MAHRDSLGGGVRRWLDATAAFLLLGSLVAAALSGRHWTVSVRPSSPQTTGQVEAVIERCAQDRDGVARDLTELSNPPTFTVDVRAKRGRVAPLVRCLTEGVGPTATVHARDWSWNASLRE